MCFQALDGKEPWPKCGGANGSIRFDPEIKHAANGGLKNALALLEPIKEKYKDIGYADFYQLASAVAVEVCIFRRSGRSLLCQWYTGSLLPCALLAEARPFLSTSHGCMKI